MYHFHQGYHLEQSYIFIDRGDELQVPCLETCFEILNLAHVH